MGSVLDGGPASPDPTVATRELARRLVRLLHQVALSPELLATEPDVPYTAAQLNRYLYGQELPPLHLVEIIASKTGADRGELWRAYDDAVAARGSATARHSGSVPSRRGPLSAPPAHLPPTTRGPDPHRPAPWEVGRSTRRTNRSRLVALGVSAAAATTVLTVTAAVTLLGNDSPTSGNAPRPRGPAYGPASSAEPAPEAPLAATGDDDGKAPAPGADELIRNGGFTDSAAEWLMSHNVRTQIKDHVLQLQVTEKIGNDAADALFMQHLPRVQPSAGYVLRFKANASKETLIKVAVQRDMGSGAPTLLTGETRLTTKMQTYSYRFVAQGDPSPPAVCFQIGGLDKGVTLSLDSVSLTEEG